ncbi:hypothetical protein E4P41_09175 [Geodermatophilus sp. DF01-2]|nr:hypothetical protein E4P41_09175 [Geodermatophilus sp. DF01_2]
MTTPADATAAEEAFEACLAGRPLPDGASGLAAFTDAVRASATAPGRPNAALAELLATGLLAPIQEPSRGTDGRPARSSRKRHRMFLPALVVKFASAGAVAKATAGAGVALVAFTGAASADVLPEPVQTTVEEVADLVVPGGEAASQPVVEPAPEDPAVDGGTAPDVPVTGGDTPEVPGTEDATDVPATETPATDAPATDAPPTAEQWQQGPAEGQSFGGWVSEGAQAGLVDGRTVSEQARERNEQRRAERQGAPQETLEKPPAVPAPVAEEPAEEPAVERPTPAPAPAGGHGRGNGGK